MKRVCCQSVPSKPTPAIPTVSSARKQAVGQMCFSELSELTNPLYTTTPKIKLHSLVWLKAGSTEIEYPTKAITMMITMGISAPVVTVSLPSEIQRQSQVSPTRPRARRGHLPNGKSMKGAATIRNQSSCVAIQPAIRRINSRNLYSLFYS